MLATQSSVLSDAFLQGRSALFVVRMFFFALLAARGSLLVVHRDDSASKVLTIGMVIVFIVVPVLFAGCRVLIFVLACDIFVFLRAHPLFFFLGNFGRRKLLKGLEQAVLR